METRSSAARRKFLNPQLNSTVIPEQTKQEKQMNEQINMHNHNNLRQSWLNQQIQQKNPQIRAQLAKLQAMKSLATNLNLGNSPNIVIGGVAIDEKPFGYRPMLGNFKLFAYKHMQPYFVD